MRRASQGWGSQFDHLAEQVWQMMKEVQKSNFFRSQTSPEWCPRVNLYETADAFVVCVELAGVERDRIDVHIENRMLAISGTRDKPVLRDQTGQVGVHLMEIDSGEFRREILIPANVDVEQISANFREGFLWVVLPRSAASAGSTRT